MISCVIHTRNSELYLKDVLRSVAWCDEIVVVDMESTDSTITIAREAGAIVVPHANIGFADPARQFGLEQTKGEWILSIDSDEIVPRALAEELIKVAREDSVDVVDLCFRNFFFGRELRGSGWSWRHIVVTRFFRRGSLEYSSKVHDFIRIRPEARRRRLIRHDLAILHFNYLDVRQFIEKLNRYTDFEALKPAPARIGPALLYQCLRELGGRFFILGGWKDGWVGFYLSWGMAFYRMSALAKQSTMSRERIIAGYNDIAAHTAMLRKP